MRQLDHPNIVRLIDFSESRQYYYIILELCPGGELFHQIVRLTYFSEDLSRHVITQVANAMIYLHEEKGVVHRYVAFEELIKMLTVPVISNQKICCSIQFLLFQPEIQSLEVQMTRIKLMKVNSSTVLVAVALVRSRSQISVSPRLYGILRL